MAYYLEILDSDDESIAMQQFKHWNILNTRRECYNASSDSFAFDMPSDPGADEMFPYGQKIRVWKDDEVKFVGWRVDSVWTGSERLSQREYKFAGPWEYLFLRKVFQQNRKSFGAVEQAVISPYESMVILGENLNGTLQHMADQIAEIVNFVIAQTVTEFGHAQFQLGDTFPQFYTPPDQANALTCGEALLKMYRWLGAGTLWFDYTTDPPTLHMVTRDKLPPITLPIVGAEPRIKRRDDLIPSCIHFQYRVINNFQGVDYVEIEHDIACPEGETDANGTTPAELLALMATAGSPSLRFGARVGSFDFQGVSLSRTSATIATTDFTPTSLEWWKNQFKELGDYQNLQMTDGPSTVADGDGDVPLPDLPNILTDGAIAPWMGGRVVGGYAEATFSYEVLENPPPNHGGRSVAKVLSATKRVRVAVTDLYSGTYFNGTIGAGDVVPFGLAKQLYDIEKIPQYEGVYRLVEAEITDVAPVGTVLNLSGGRDEWEIMNAQVQSVAYEYETGTTEIAIGPAAHLGEVDLIARLRVNRAFRQTVSTGNRSTAETNNGAVVMGQNLPKGTKDAAHAKVSALTLIDGIQSKNPAAVGQIIIDSAQRLIKLTAGPGDGSITINLPTGGLDVRFLSVPCCENFVDGYRYILSSEFQPGSPPPGVGG